MLSDRLHNSPRFAKLRLWVMLCCVLLLTPVGTLRAASLARVALNVLTETESRPQTEYETASEILLDGRTSSRRTRDVVRYSSQSCCKCEPSKARLCNARVGFAYAGRSAEILSRNGCGAVLRC